MFQRVILSAQELAEQDAKHSNDMIYMRTNFAHPEEQGVLDFVHDCCAVQMPEKLLRGPWSADDVQFLYYLSWSGLGIDWSRSTLGEVAASGLARAIADGQRKVVASLTTPVVGVQPTMDMLRLAIVRYGCDKTIVFYLVCAAVRSVTESRGLVHSDSSPTDLSFRDPSIWSFAGRAPSDTGRWLKDLLRAAADIALRGSQDYVEIFKELRTICGRESDGVERIWIAI